MTTYHCHDMSRKNDPHILDDKIQIASKANQVLLKQFSLFS